MAAPFRRFSATVLANGLLARGLSAGIGYKTGVGVGSTATQQTNRATGVQIDKLSGAITTSNASLAAEATADFVVTNNKVAIGDVVAISVRSGSNGGGTTVSVIGVANGSFTIRVHNGNVAAGTAETGAIVINFVVLKGTSN
jgi:hypothetical protein